jgi:DNA-nicking Smr family endonuclease
VSASKKTSKKKGGVDPNSPFAALRGVKERLTQEEAARASAAGNAGKKGAPPERPRERPRTEERTEKGDREDDRLSFQRMMSGVTPIEQTKGRMPRSAQVPPSAELVPRGRAAEAKAAVETETDQVHAHLRALVEGRERFEVEDDGANILGRRLDLPMDLLRRLRRGLMPVDARMDLHGLGAVEAREKVESFLREKRASGERCVLIIHGKGEHSPRAQPVLRGEIGAWLSQGAASEHVAGFATAARDDGGEGAVYVLLRR